MTVLIADDEGPAREELRYLLKSHPRLRVVGEAANGTEALDMAAAAGADLVFLDISMPGLSGLEAARQMASFPIPPRIVFVTAHDEFALEAFELNAVDYLLKPVDEGRLAKTVDRLESRPAIDAKVLEDTVRRLLDDRIPEAAGTAGGAAIDKVTVYRDGSFLPVDFRDLVLLAADGKQSRIVTRDGSYPYRRSLKDLERLVQAPFLFKCHRSYTVNLDCIETVDAWFNGTMRIRLAGVAEPVPVSRSRTPELRSVLKMD